MSDFRPISMGLARLRRMVRCGAPAALPAHVGVVAAYLSALAHKRSPGLDRRVSAQGCRATVRSLPAMNGRVPRGGPDARREAAERLQGEFARH